jgi:hypothetical protein
MNIIQCLFFNLFIDFFYRFKMRPSVASLPDSEGPLNGGGLIRVRVRPSCPTGPLVNASMLPTNGLAAPSPLGAARRIMRETLTACSDVPLAVTHLSTMEGFDTQIAIGGVNVTVKIPALETVDGPGGLISWFETLCNSLGCCPGLFVVEPMNGPCSKCTSSTGQQMSTLKRPHVISFFF